MIGLVPQELTTDVFDYRQGDRLPLAGACSAKKKNPLLSTTRKC